MRNILKRMFISMVTLLMLGITVNVVYPKFTMLYVVYTMWFTGIINLVIGVFVEDYDWLLG